MALGERELRFLFQHAVRLSRWATVLELYSLAEDINARAAQREREARALASVARNPAAVIVVLKMGLALTVKPDDYTFTYR